MTKLGTSLALIITCTAASKRYNIINAFFYQEALTDLG